MPSTRSRSRPTRHAAALLCARRWGVTHVEAAAALAAGPVQHPQRAVSACCRQLVPAGAERHIQHAAAPHLDGLDGRQAAAFAAQVGQELAAALPHHAAALQVGRAQQPVSVRSSSGRAAPWWGSGQAPPRGVEGGVVHMGGVPPGGQATASHAALGLHASTLAVHTRACFAAAAPPTFLYTSMLPLACAARNWEPSVCGTQATACRRLASCALSALRVAVMVGLLPVVGGCRLARNDINTTAATGEGQGAARC
jgi:hypothetical protein